MTTEQQVLNSKEALNDLNELFEEWKGKCTLSEIKNAIEGSKYARHSCWESFAPFSSLCQLADAKGHFVADIIKRAWNGGNVSTKQAWCVAFFAKENTCIVKS